MEEKKYERKENAKAFIRSASIRMVEGACTELVCRGIAAVIDGIFGVSAMPNTENTFGPTNFFGAASFI